MTDAQVGNLPKPPARARQILFLSPPANCAWQANLICSIDVNGTLHSACFIV